MAQSNNIPTNPAFLYRENYTSIGHAPERLTTIPSNINGVFMFHGVPNGATDGSFVYSAPTGISQPQENADIQTLKAAGVKLFLTVGGAFAQIPIDSQTNADNFVASVLSVNTQLGGTIQDPAFQGIDFNNFETVTDTNQFTYMTNAALQLKSIFGLNFAILAPPAIFGRTEGGQAWIDRELLANMYYGDGTTRGLDLIFPQFYDGPGNNTLSSIQTVIAFYNTPIDIGGGNIVQIPLDHIGIGYGVKPSDPNWWTAANAAQAYTDYVNGGGTPKGAMNFSVNNDPTHTFSTTVVPVITNNVAPPATTAGFYGVNDLSLGGFLGVNDVSLGGFWGVNELGIEPTYETPALQFSSFDNGLEDASVSFTTNSDTTLIVLATMAVNSHSQVPTDNQGNTYVQATTYTNADPRVRIYYCANPVQNALTVIDVGSTTGQFIGTLIGAAFSGTASTQNNIQENGGNAFGTSLATGSVTTTLPNSLAIVAYGVNGSASPITIDSGFTEIAEQDFVGGASYGGMMAYKVITDPGSVSATVTRTNQNGQAIAIATFDAAQQ